MWLSPVWGVWTWAIAGARAIIHSYATRLPFKCVARLSRVLFFISFTCALRFPRIHENDVWRGSLFSVYGVSIYLSMNLSGWKVFFDVRIRFFCSVRFPMGVSYYLMKKWSESLLTRDTIVELSRHVVGRILLATPESCEIVFYRKFWTALSWIPDYHA